MADVVGGVQLQPLQGRAVGVFISACRERGVIAADDLFPEVRVEECEVTLERSPGVVDPGIVRDALFRLEVGVAEVMRSP
jgi:hypothetical protein